MNFKYTNNIIYMLIGYDVVISDFYLQDKLVFSLLLTVTIMVAEGVLRQVDVMFVLSGAAPRVVPPKVAAFLSPQAWNDLCG